MPKLVASIEQSAPDPETGAPGILRSEWRVDKVKPEAYDRLRKHFGPYALLNHWLLEHRYIRRGAVESWTPVDMFSTRRQALEDIDRSAFSHDAELSDIQHQRKALEEQQRREAQEKAEAEGREEEARAKRHESRMAFNRLLDSKDKLWAEQWNAFIARKASDKAFKEWAQNNVEFRLLYDAVMDAVTVPRKRAAIKSVLAVYGKE